MRNVAPANPLKKTGNTAGKGKPLQPKSVCQKHRATPRKASSCKTTLRWARVPAAMAMTVIRRTSLCVRSTPKLDDLTNKFLPLRGHITDLLHHLASGLQDLRKEHTPHPPP